MGLPQTAIVSHGTVVSVPSETYGEGDIILRIGNGGAGPTGLLRTLADGYLSTLSGSQRGSITWVSNHSRNTQLALYYNYIDLALTYERDQEAISVAEGWAVDAGCIFHDHFCISGPITDPAGIRSCKTIPEALRRIGELGGSNGDRDRKGILWYSRNDKSATMWKERLLWSTIGFMPWEHKLACEKWYKRHLHTPAEALIAADAAGAYLLIDRATLLRQTGLRTIKRTTVFFEPEGKEDVLMNSCYALVSGEGEEKTQRVEHIERFLEWVKGEKGQDLIKGFGIEEVGLPFFAGVVEGFATSVLRGGMPRAGKWIIGSKV